MTLQDEICETQAVQRVPAPGQDLPVPVWDTDVLGASSQDKLALQDCPKGLCREDEPWQMWSLPQSQIGSQQCPTKGNVTFYNSILLAAVSSASLGLGQAAAAQPCDFRDAICCLHPPKVVNKSRTSSIMPDPHPPTHPGPEHSGALSSRTPSSSFPSSTAHSQGPKHPLEGPFLVRGFWGSWPCCSFWQGLSYTDKVWALLPQTEDTPWLGSLNSKMHSFSHGKVVLNALHCHNPPICPWSSQFPSVKWRK